MNTLSWLGTIAWGIFVTGFGLTGMGAQGAAVQPQDVMLLITGGAVTCLIGLVGLGMGSIPGARSEPERRFECSQAYGVAADK